MKVEQCERSEQSVRTSAVQPYGAVGSKSVCGHAWRTELALDGVVIIVCIVCNRAVIVVIVYVLCVMEQLL